MGLQKENASLREKNETLAKQHQLDMDVLGEFKDENTRLRNGLRRYGRHRESCRIMKRPLNNVSCNCELDELLKE